MAVDTASNIGVLGIQLQLRSSRSIASESQIRSNRDAVGIVHRLGADSLHARELELFWESRIAYS